MKFKVHVPEVFLFFVFFLMGSNTTWILLFSFHNLMESATVFIFAMDLVWEMSAVSGFLSTLFCSLKISVFCRGLSVYEEVYVRIYGVKILN